MADFLSLLYGSCGHCDLRYPVTTLDLVTRHHNHRSVGVTRVVEQGCHAGKNAGAQFAAAQANGDIGDF